MSEVRELNLHTASTPLDDSRLERPPIIQRTEIVTFLSDRIAPDQYHCRTLRGACILPAHRHSHRNRHNAISRCQIL